MNSLQGIGVAVFVSLAVSSIVVAGLMQPLRTVLRRACLAGDGEHFWARFTAVMLFVAPLLIALVFGLPSAEALIRYDAGQVAQKVLSATMFGMFATLGGIGLKMASIK